jgi:integrase
MITLGLRLGEALAVRRQDFNADFSELMINQALNFHTAQASTPKRESVRLLAMPPHLQARCKAHWTALLEQRGDPDFANHGIFCPSEAGTPIQPRNFERMWAGQTKNGKFYPGMNQKAGLPESTVLHDLRAFTATMLVETEAPAVVVGHVLGHGAKNVTELYMRRYLPTMRRALEKFEALVWGIDSQIDSSAQNEAFDADASKAS